MVAGSGRVEERVEERTGTAMTRHFVLVDFGD